MTGYCPECGWNMDAVIFYGNNGAYLRACCTFCGYTAPVVTA